MNEENKVIENEEKVDKTNDIKDEKKVESNGGNNKKIIIGIVACVVIIGGIFGITKMSAPERKVEFKVNEIEASEKVELDSIVTVKDEYKDKYEVALKNIDEDYTKVGEHEIVFTLTNKENNKTQEITKTFNVVDTTAPTLNIKKKISVTEGKKFNVNKYISANDIVDGKIAKENIKVDGKVNTKKPGKYTLTISVTDNAGNKASKKVTVVVKKDELTADEFFEKIVGVWKSNGYGYVSFSYDGGYSCGFFENFNSGGSNGTISSLSINGTVATGVYSYMADGPSGSESITIDLGADGDGMITVNGHTYTYAYSSYQEGLQSAPLTGYTY